jgi:hypothetical protein
MRAEVRDILYTLEARLRQAAEEGRNELRVMGLRQNEHFKPSLMLSLAKAIQEEDGGVITEQRIIGSAWEVYKHLIKLNLQVKIEEEPMRDESQSRSWTNYHLVAYGW